MVEEIHDCKVLVIGNVTAERLSVILSFFSFSSCSNIPGCGDWVTLCGFSFRHGPFVPTTTTTVRHSKSTDLFKE